VPQKLDDCVAKVKSKGGVDNPWAVCNASIGKENDKKTKEQHNPIDIPFGKEAKTTHDKDSANGSIKAEIAEAIIQEKINANRQVPYSSPPITNRKVEPQINKTTKGIGGQVGKIDSTANTNNMTTSMWKKILDTQLRRNVKEPRY